MPALTGAYLATSGLSTSALFTAETCKGRAHDSIVMSDRVVDDGRTSSSRR